MAFLTPNPKALAETISRTAAGKAAQAVSQAASPKLVSDVQRVLSVGGMVGNILGLRTGIQEIDNLMGLGDARDTATPLLGGLTLRQAEAIYEQVSAARVAKKNLFFIRVTDENPPSGDYQPREAGGANSLAGLVKSRIGPAIDAVAAGISNAVSRAGSALGLKVSSSAIAPIALKTFDLLALDVSYGPSLAGDHVQVGSSFLDRPAGRNPTEMQITTMDDEAGTIKRWVEMKTAQLARSDGTFGLPAEYLVTIEVFHAIPSDQVPGYTGAYSKKMRMRVVSSQHDLSRRDQALSECQLQFQEFDPFMGTT